MLHLRNVTAVGVTDYLEESLGMLEAVWQAVPRQTAGTRENSNPHSSSELTVEELAALRACDALDRKLFVRVRRRFVSQRAACRATGKCGPQLLTPWEPWASETGVSESRKRAKGGGRRRAKDQPLPSLAVKASGRQCWHSCQDSCQVTYGGPPPAPHCWLTRGCTQAIWAWFGACLSSPAPHEPEAPAGRPRASPGGLSPSGQ